MESEAPAKGRTVRRRKRIDLEKQGYGKTAFLLFCRKERISTGMSVGYNWRMIKKVYSLRKNPRYLVGEGFHALPFCRIAEWGADAHRGQRAMCIEQNGRSEPLPYNGGGQIWNPPLQ